MSFDAETQEALAESIGIPQADHPTKLFGFAIAAAGALVAFYAFWGRLRTRPRADRLKTLYEKFCRALGALGVAREPWEGPADYCMRAGRLLPNESRRIEKISQVYIALRYSRRGSAPLLEEFAREIERFPSA